MKILSKPRTHECDFCEKEKDDVSEVELENGRTANICWTDLKKLARLNLKEAGDAPRKAGG